MSKQCFFMVFLGSSTFPPCSSPTSSPQVGSLPRQAAAPGAAGGIGRCPTRRVVRGDEGLLEWAVVPLNESFFFGRRPLSEGFC